MEHTESRRRSIRVIWRYFRKDVRKRRRTLLGGAAIAWSRDGRELFFLNNHRDLVAVPVSLRPTFSSGVPRRLFATAQYGSPGPKNPFAAR